MAKLHPKPYPGDWDLNWNGDIKAEIARTDALLGEIPSDKIVSFQVADNYARYFVKSLSPLVLQHIPYSDGYQIDAAYMRGLRRSDIERKIAADRSIRQLLAPRK